MGEEASAREWTGRPLLNLGEPPPQRLLLAAFRGRRSGDHCSDQERQYWASVSAQNIEIVRRIYEAWNSGDPGLKLFDPNFELHQGAGIIDSAGVFRGHDGLLRAGEELFSGLRDLSWDPEDFIGAPNNKVVVSFRFRATGRSTGVPVEAALVHVWTLRDELAIRCETYEPPHGLAEALEAVGLRR